MNLNPLTDFDLGLKALYYYVGDTDKDFSQILNEIFDQGRERDNKIAELKTGKHRYKKIKKVDHTGFLTTLFLAIIAEASVWVFKKKPEYADASKLVAAVAFAIWGAIWLGVNNKEKKKHKEKKEQVRLKESEIRNTEKLHLLIEGIGRLFKARRDKNGGINVDEESELCFKCIRKLPEKIYEMALPQKEIFASLIIQLFPEKHPLKEALWKLQKDREENTDLEAQESPYEGVEGPFVDVGQQQPPDFDRLGAEPDAIKRWQKIKRKMGGLHLRYFDLEKGKRLPNPLYPNSYV